MAIPNEKLQQLLQEISGKAAFAEQQLGIVRAQIASKNRENRMLQLSSTEMDALPKDTPVYDGVGKMFVQTSIPDVKARQAKEAEEVKKELANLDKKLHYLETTYKNSQEHLEAILKRGG
ncbi:Prefoldin [Teratosphaeria nubilosa]|uniref:Prefoldin n=1 Tax=Teratosphaeria nubilosa TaxID=161662 RepID=A0A6G1LGJ7_9PEZI|nr:Prefoldin [Teratosphaeria nubilosa]